MHDCIFCQIAKGKAPSFKVYEDENVYAFLDINPVSEYHTLVIPKNHYTSIFDAPEQELSQVMAAVKRILSWYREKLGISNVQIINSSGPEAQQDVFHVHFHIVPRRNGDGQDIVWKTYPGLREKFAEMIERIK